MSKLGPLIPLTGLGGGVKRIVSAGAADHVLVLTDKMVHQFNVVDNCVVHTWYADTGSNIKDCCASASSDNAQQIWILANKRTIIKADMERNKIEDCVKVELDAEATRLVNVDNMVWVVFANGGVRQLEYYQSEDADEHNSLPDDVVSDCGLIVETVVSCNISGQWSVTHLVENSNGQLSLVRGRLVLDTVAGVHSLEDIATTALSLSKDSIVTWHLDPWSQLTVVTPQHDILQICPDTGREQRVVSIPGGKHVSLCHVSRDQLAVMGTLTEGGYLYTVSTTFNCITGKCQLKTTSHSGKGLFLLGDDLYVCVSNRVVRVRPGGAGLDRVLGSQASDIAASDNGPAALLNDNVLSQADMPEYLIMDCVIQMLDTSELSLERQAEIMRLLMSHDVSHPVMSQQITDRLSIDQVLRLLNILETLLSSKGVGQEERILEWINMLVTCHYLHMVVAKDQNMEGVRLRLQATVANIQETLKNLTFCKVSVKNLLETKVPPVQVNNQAYAIEIIQI